ncbi:hypothetical protein ANH9381_0789 [Aggregatibacter actinomycetemcomitans ANH9381]|nr:hypothetical protein ANH9381_0789 [Aggregatibacter actinomycetemcomitans ANH9381]
MVGNFVLFKHFPAIVDKRVGPYPKFCVNTYFNLTVVV